jgi:hypothetical protein
MIIGDMREKKKEVKVLTTQKGTINKGKQLSLHQPY